MSLTLAQMKGLIHEIQPILSGASLLSCVVTQDQKVIIKFDNQKSLLICLKTPFLRFHLTQHNWTDIPNSFSRQIDHQLNAWKLEEFNLLNDDRILKLVFEKKQSKKILIFELIPKRANGYFINDLNEIVAALHPTPQKVYTAPLSTFISSQPEVLMSSDVENTYATLEAKEAFEEKKRCVEIELKKQHKQISKAKIKLTDQLNEALLWENIQHEATLLQANLFKIKRGMSDVTVLDWNQDQDVQIHLDPTLNPAEDISLRFKKSKKLKRAIEPLTRQIEKIQKDQDKISQLLIELEKIDSENVLKNFCQKNYLTSLQAKPKNYSKPEPALPYREFITAQGLKVWVGKSAKDNDKLTFNYANGSDYWLHARDVPGSHVVLHLGKTHSPDEESIQDAVQVALFYSKAKDSQEGEVSITQCKYVRRFGANQPGKVQISEHRVVYAKIDQERLKQLKERGR